MDELTKLAIKYGTDKWGKHHYTPIYYDLFKDRRNEIKSVLEIGAGEGSGLRMFRDFFPNAMIYGAEIEDKRLFKEERIDVFKFDQASVKDIYEKISEFKNLDIVIDDGSHDPMEQLFTCYGAMSLLNKDATYIIEDVARKDIAKFLRRKYDVKVIKCGKRYDDRLVVVRHK